MRWKSVMAAAGAAIFAVHAAFAGPSMKRGQPALSLSATRDAGVKEMKGVLFRLVRQDGYLDEAIETLASADGPLSADGSSSAGISAMGLSLRLIKNSLEQISALNKKRFSEVRPYAGAAIYAKTILSYSRKIAAKAGRTEELVSAALAKGGKPAVRDAVSAPKGEKVKGKTLTLMLRERKSLEMLSADIRSLKASAEKLHATSRWLYIVSK